MPLCADTPLSLGMWILLAATGAVAGLVDAIAGGGGLLTVPVLLGVGLPPVAALGTNKLQASFGSATAAWNYWRAGWIGLRESAAGVVWTALGSALGALAVGRLSESVLRKSIPLLLLGAVAFLVLRPRFGTTEGRPLLRRGLFHGLLGLALGGYDGFFGPGVGALWTFAYLALQGLNLTQATAHTKLMNLTSNFIALSIFASRGTVCLGPGLVMGLGQLVGARIGARLVIYRQARLIRPVFIVMVMAVALKLLWTAS